jgi:hypothetical protein
MKKFMVDRVGWWVWAVSMGVLAPTMICGSFILGLLIVREDHYGIARPDWWPALSVVTVVAAVLYLATDRWSEWRYGPSEDA